MKMLDVYYNLEDAFSDSEFSINLHANLHFDEGGLLESSFGPSLHYFPQPLRQILWLAGLWNSEPVFRCST